MEQEVPTWLNHTFLTLALQSGENTSQKVTITRFSCNPAVKEGNNYLSQVYRVQVEYSYESLNVQSKSFIVKVPITKGAMIELTAGTGFFAVEPRMYNEVIPKLNNEIKREFGPKTLYCDLKYRLVLEDMRDLGYVMCDRIQQLDFTHCESVVTLLAQYHAASVVLHIENPQLIETVGIERMYVEGKSFSEGYKPWIESGLRTVGEILNEREEFKPLAEYVISQTSSVVQKVLNVCKPKSKGLNVLNHGDLWTNNILFKYSGSGEVSDVKLIDFQIPRFCSPAVDLITFIWSSANEEVRQSRIKDLIDVYLQKLNATLTQLGCEQRLTSDELREDLEFSLEWGIVTICCELPIMLCDSQDTINLETINVGDLNSESFKKAFNSKSYRIILPGVVAKYRSWSSGVLMAQC